MQMTRDQLVTLCGPTKHPEAARIEALAAAAARRAGVLTAANEARFLAFNTLTAYVYPTAPVERAVVCAQWCNWLFFFDDAHDEGVEGDVVSAVESPVDPTRAARTIRDYVDLLDDPDRGSLARLVADPLARYALDFRDRALGLAGPGWLARFMRHVREYLLQGTLPACAHWAAGSVPRVNDYLAQRDHDSAVQTAIDLIELAHGIELPDELHAARGLVELRAALVRTVALFNDIVSYPKEVLRHHNPNNLVHVLMSAGFTYDGALREALRLVNQSAVETRACGEAVVARYRREVPAISVYVDGTYHWQRGNIESSLREARYRAAESPFVELRG